jgi:hypothetical protein
MSDTSSKTTQFAPLTGVGKPAVAAYAAQAGASAAPTRTYIAARLSAIGSPELLCVDHLLDFAVRRG